ncbi:pimeloyl-ACP methyl ester carboxylesterase [Tamaricihabitans halophyticus]|uniref:Pimeloyl-ACP methyl ester carboxylesterase n=1 Tax=Tamaricihabitans halophyticus TaxID=1262583 RepID=A0A4V6NRG3_9PSEU|nr:alpha/beta hydrolase [Tamaricihabitans halophyticus]TCP56866.1 pimeloyl-ACP methyl ester carboxylesterase [Tamaricihabitans halophyticus]
MRARPDPSTVRIDGPWTHHDVYANGIRLHVASLGSGPLVVLLHGFGEFWWVWHRQLDALASAGFRAVAVDLRGYGDSDKPPRGYDGWTLAGDVAGLVKAMGARRAHFVGHAWGGMLACTVAALHPRVVSSVGLLGATHPLALRGQIARTAFRRRGNNQLRAAGHLFRFQVPMRPERWLTHDDAANTEKLVRGWAAPRWRDSADYQASIPWLRRAMQVQGVAHSALEYYRWAFRSQLRGDGRRFAAAVAAPSPVPMLQIHGELDTCVLPNTARLAQRWGGTDYKYQELSEVGHFPHLEAPAETNALLLNALRQAEKH